MTAPRALPDPPVVEIALSVLAQKLRTELMLGVLEDWAAGQRTTRWMLVEFQRAERVLAGDLPPSLAPAADLHTSPGQEWERLRQNARDRGRPIPEWEVFYGLQRIVGLPAAAGHPLAVDVGLVESEMQLDGGLGLDWSLHEYLRDARERVGPAFRPAPPEQVAAMLLRIDASRQLLKPGGFTLGFRIGTEGPERPIDPDVMRALEATVRGPLVEALNAAAGLQLLRGGARAGNDRTTGGGQVEQAMVAGAAVARAQARRASAADARRRAKELRTSGVSVTPTAIFATGMTLGVGAISSTVAASGDLWFGDFRAQLLTAAGLTMATLGMAANAFKDWRPVGAALAAPPRAWFTEQVAELAEWAAEREIARLTAGRPPTPRAWRLAQVAVGRAAASPPTTTAPTTTTTGTAPLRPPTPAQAQHRLPPGGRHRQT